MKYRELDSEEVYYDLQNVRSSIDICHLKVGAIEKYLKSKSDFILDIGCRNAGFVNECMSKGYTNCYGMDIGEQSMNLIKRKFPHFIADSRVKQFDIHNGVPFDETFDLITMSHVLEHLHSVKHSLDHIKSHMNESSILYIVVPQENTMNHLPHYSIFESLDDLTNLLVQNGFETVHAESTRRNMTELKGAFKLNEQ